MLGCRDFQTTMKVFVQINGEPYSFYHRFFRKTARKTFPTATGAAAHCCAKLVCIFFSHVVAFQEWPGPHRPTHHSRVKLWDLKPLQLVGSLHISGYTSQTHRLTRRQLPAMLLEISQRLWNLSQHGLEIMRQPYCQWHRAPPTPGGVPSWIAWWESTRYLLLQWLHLTPQPPQEGYRA